MYGPIVLIIVSSILITTIVGKLPADIKPCKAGDTNCLIETINKIIETKYGGDPELNLISIDPLKIDKMGLKQPQNSAVNIKLDFQNAEVRGYKDFRVYDVRGFGANPEGKHEIFLRGPLASLEGDYSIDGKVLILPIKGEGKGHVSLENVFFRIKILAGSKVKDGATYMDVKKVKLNLNTTMFHINLSNLFNGDKALGDNLNKFMNENWHDMYVELKQSVLDAFGVIYTDFIRKLFAAHPYKELIEGGN